jgi:hypothetical protein
LHGLRRGGAALLESMEKSERHLKKSFRNTQRPC